MKRDVFWPLVAMLGAFTVFLLWIAAKDGAWGLLAPAFVCAALFVKAIIGRPISGGSGA